MSHSAFYLSHHLMQIVLQYIKVVVWFGFFWRHPLVLLFSCRVAKRDGELQTYEGDLGKKKKKQCEVC